MEQKIFEIIMDENFPNRYQTNVQDAQRVVSNTDVKKKSNI